MKKIVAIIFSIIFSVASISCLQKAEESVNTESSQNSEVSKYYTIYYDIGNDSYAEIEKDNQTVVYNGELSLYEPTRYGYEFLGWLEKDTNEPFTLTTYTIEGDTYLVANWKVDSDSDRWFTPDI